MPAVRITANTVVNRRNVRAGEVVMCSEADARLLIRIGKAESAAGEGGSATAALLKPARTDRQNRTHHTRGNP